jgi:predicted transcriptional regulator
MNGSRAFVERLSDPCRQFLNGSSHSVHDLQAAPREFEKAVLPLFRSSHRRMTPDEIVTHLSSRGLPYSTHTVRTYLSRLVSKGILTSSRKKPFGYCLAEARSADSSCATEQDIVATLCDVGFRMTRRALQAALYQRGLDWDEAQLSRDLLRLLDAGRITFQPSILPPGYGLAEWGTAPRTLGDEPDEPVHRSPRTRRLRTPVGA